MQALWTLIGNDTSSNLKINNKTAWVFSKLSVFPTDGRASVSAERRPRDSTAASVLEVHALDHEFYS